MAISRLRDAARARSRLATLKHVIDNRTPTATYRTSTRRADLAGQLFAQGHQDDRGVVVERVRRGQALCEAGHVSRGGGHCRPRVEPGDTLRNRPEVSRHGRLRGS